MSLARWALCILCFGCDKKPTPAPPPPPPSFWNSQNNFLFYGIRLLAGATLLLLLVYGPLTWVESQFNSIRDASITATQRRPSRQRHDGTTTGWGGRRAWLDRRSGSCPPRQSTNQEGTTSHSDKANSQRQQRPSIVEQQPPVRMLSPADTNPLARWRPAPQDGRDKNTTNKSEKEATVESANVPERPVDNAKEQAQNAIDDSADRALIKFGSATRLPDDSSPVNIVRRNPLRKPVTFHWDGGGRQVHLCGSFFSWLRRTPMEYNSKTLRHELTIMLPIGYHEYKFYVDGVYRTSDNQPTCPNGFGSKNHKLRVM